MFFYYDFTWPLMLIAVAVTLFAQVRVSSTYSKYGKMRSRKGLSGHDAARLILDYNGLNDVRVEQVRGHLSDHYDPRTKVLRLSETTFHSDSVAALGVAAHEVGHAIQDQENYAPLRIRGALVPVANFGSQAAWILVIIGLFIGSSLGVRLMDLGILFFAVAVLFQLVTLPVEFNASSRALAALEGGGILDVEETKQTKKVLSAAALTYVAAAFTAILQLLRLILIRNSRD